MSGLLFLAIRLGMGSILPAILVHFLWDFVVFLNPQSSIGGQGWLDLLSFGAVLGPPLFGVIGIVALVRMQRSEAS